MRWIEMFDRLDPESAGWGLIVPETIDPEIEEALQPLIDYRRQAAAGRYQRLTYMPGETKNDFLARCGVGPGPVEPELVPYYLLMVGDPIEVPFHLQFQLDIGHAVGRLCLETPDNYAAYASSVIEHEQRLRKAPHVALFGVQNDDDRLTELMMDNLLRPLEQIFQTPPKPWTADVTTGDDATKTKLTQIFHGNEGTPDLLFTAAHGSYFPNGHELQVHHQGGVMCADWPGPEAWKDAVPPDFYFSVDDLGDDADVAGMIAFMFGCYTAGTPKVQCFSTPDHPFEAAQQDFIARLPQRLLSHPRGGALAVIGSVDLTQDETFLWQEGVRVRLFELVMRHLMHGDPVGVATEHLNRCAAELASDLLTAGYEHSLQIDNEEEVHTRLWRAYQDARGYIVLGDPATRLHISQA